jgi:hypothetical protein
MIDHAIVEGAVLLKAAVDMVKAVRSLAPPAKPDLLPVYRLTSVERPSDHQAAADVADPLGSGGLGPDGVLLGLFTGADDRGRGPRDIPHDLMFHD